MNLVVKGFDLLRRVCVENEGYDKKYVRECSKDGLHEKQFLLREKMGVMIHDTTSNIEREDASVMIFHLK